MPVDDILSSWENEAPKEKGWSDSYSYSSRSNSFSLKIAEHLDNLRKTGNYEQIIQIKERLDNLQVKSNGIIPSFADCYPSWLHNLNINSDDSLKLLTKKLPEDSFRHYFDRYKNVYIPFELLPDNLTEEEKNKYIKSILLKENITCSDIEEYSKLTDKDVFQAMTEDKDILLNILNSKDENLNNLILNSENYNNILREGLNILFEKWDYNSIMELKEKYNISDESINLAAEKSFSHKIINNNIINYNIYDAMQIKDKFNLSEQFISSVAEKVFKDSILNGNLYSAINIKEKFNIPEELINSAIEEGIIVYLSKGDISSVYYIKNNFNISEKVFILAIEKGLINKLSEGNINFVLEIKRNLNISDEFIKSTELIPIAEKGFISQLSLGNLNDLSKIKSNFNLSEEFLMSPEVISAAKNGAIANIQKGELFLFNTINADFNLPEEFIKSPEISSVVKEGLIHILGKNSTNNVSEFIEKFNISDEFLMSPEVISAAEQGYIIQISNGYIDQSLFLKEKFNISDEFLMSPEVISANEQLFSHKLSYGYIDDALYVKNNFNISEQYIISAVESLVKNSLIYGNFNLIFNLKNKFNISDDFYNSHFEELIIEIKKQENGEVKAQSLKNIQDSFLVSQNREKLPEQIKVVLDRFENQYGNKGKNLIALAICAYGIENPENFERKIKNIENVLNKYNPDTIPEGVKTSIGIEDEITTSVGKIYKERSHLGYTNDIELVSRSSNIGQGGGGSGAIYEFTTKPTYNPYILMAEIKILQDAGFVDLNFEEYPQASRAYHLSLVGDSGLYVDKNMYFLNNIMTMAQLTGITAGLDVSSTKGIHSKRYEHFNDTEQKGERCEMKGMATDSVEQFEKAILTAHNAGIAIQLLNKYFEDIDFHENFSDAEEFEKKSNERGLLRMPFESDQERNIVYEWVKLKNLTVEAINQHNYSFINNEFNGLSIDKNGELVDITDHIFVKQNEERLANAKITKEELMNEIRMNSSDLFNKQSAEFVNALTKTFNFFIFKAIHPDDGQYITIEQPDGTQKKIINMSNVVPIFNMRDEGYKTRDKDAGSNDRKKSIFDHGNEIRDGYYNIGSASEEMIIHKSQILINRFNKRMEELLQTKGEKRKVEQGNLVNV